MRMAKDIVGKPFGFLPFLRFVPPYRQRFLELSQCIDGINNYKRELNTTIWKIIVLSTLRFQTVS